MHYSPSKLLTALLETKPRPTRDAPRNMRGLYGLVDHRGDLRYIGSTSSADQNLYERIHSRHRTGSEGMSHYFSQMYNTGRMWRDRKDPTTKTDGNIAKKLRNAFIADHCSAVWLPLPDSIDISLLESEVLAIAPKNAIAWNRRGTPVYDEPIELVNITLQRLGWREHEFSALKRQRERFLVQFPTATDILTQQISVKRKDRINPFPQGPFRFFALDVETANNNRGSICQIGVACVRPDHSIETWMTYVDPQTDMWVWSSLHGISAKTVQGAPTFAEVLPVLNTVLRDHVVYQHSGFDRSAILAACTQNSCSAPMWQWRDSVGVARSAWPALKANGGYGLANLKPFLGLEFNHHDAAEDARAAAEVVLRAEDALSIRSLHRSSRDEAPTPPQSNEALFSPLEKTTQQYVSTPQASRHIGKTLITQGNINNTHIYLKDFFDKFPDNAIGGSNRSSVAPKQITVDWGGTDTVLTDLDSTKKLFRKRGWVKEFFEQNNIKVGDMVSVEEIAPYYYRVAVCSD